MSFQDFSLSEIILLDEYSSNVAQKVVDYINRYDADRLLYNFRLTAGVSNLVVDKPYPGWESSRLGGHTLGHYIVGAAQAVAHGYGNQKGLDGRTLSNRLEYIISALAECQEKSGGFIWGANFEKPDEPECQFNRLEADNAKETWAPWYTMHKLLNGVVEVYKLTKNVQALEVAEKLGEWIFNRVSKWSDETRELVWRIEYGGMNDCLYELYKCAVAAKYEHSEHFLTAAHQFDQEPLFERILNHEKNALDGNHANTTIPKFIGALNRYRTTGDKKYLEYAVAFWDTVVNHHTYVTGGNSECEFFGQDDVLDAERSNTNCETCNTHNMLKLTRELFKITGQKKYADYYETTYINAIMASVNSKTGMTTYFQPMATGCFKVYCNPDFEKNYFWCCSGTGLENFTKLGDSFYFHNDDELVVNVFESSVLCWKEKGFELEQNCNLQKSNRVVLKVKAAGNETVHSILIRVPDWCEGYSIIVNGKKISSKVEDGILSEKSESAYSESDGYIKLNREWKTGDEIILTLQMKVSVKTLPDNDKIFAFKYGPYVLAADLGKDRQFKTYQVGVQCDVCALKIVRGQKLKMSGGYGQTTGLPLLKKETLHVKVPVSEYMDKINLNLVRVAGECKFVLKGTDSLRKITFAPYYQLHDTRYGIYWQFE